MGSVAGAAGRSSSVPLPFCPAGYSGLGRSSPDPSGVGPVPGHSCRCQEGGHRLVEEEVILEGGRESKCPLGLHS